MKSTEERLLEIAENQERERKQKAIATFLALFFLFGVPFLIGFWAVNLA